MTKMEKFITAQFFIKSECINDFKSLTKDLITHTRNEEGNNFYELYQSVENTTDFVFYEAFKSHDAINFHIDTEHYKKFIKALQNLQSKDPIVKITD